MHFDKSLPVSTVYALITIIIIIIIIITVNFIKVSSVFSNGAPIGDTVQREESGKPEHCPGKNLSE